MKIDQNLYPAMAEVADQLDAQLLTDFGGDEHDNPLGKALFFLGIAGDSSVGIFPSAESPCFEDLASLETWCKPRTALAAQEGDRRAEGLLATELQRLEILG